jgi:hypothetical protein
MAAWYSEVVLKKLLLPIICLILTLSVSLSAQIDTSAVVAPIPPAPASNIVLKDNPNDNGHAVQVRWDLSPDDGAGKNNALTYEVYSSTDANAPDSLWKKRGSVPMGTALFTDKGARNSDSRDFLPKNTDFFYRIKASF